MQLAKVLKAGLSLCWILEARCCLWTPDTSKELKLWILALTFCPGQKQPNAKCDCPWLPVCLQLAAWTPPLWVMAHGVGTAGSVKWVWALPSDRCDFNLSSPGWCWPTAKLHSPHQEMWIPTKRWSKGLLPASSRYSISRDCGEQALFTWADSSLVEF